MVNGVKKLITTQDYMDALGVDDETAQILRFYQGTGGTQLYYDGGVFADGLIGRRMLLRSDFYAGIAKVKLVDRIYYKSGKDGLTWEQLAVENF